MEPLMLGVTIHHSGLLMQSITDRMIGGNADFTNGGGRGDTEGRVKEHSAWDDEW